jgi:hypothetical protein
MGVYPGLCPSLQADEEQAAAIAYGIAEAAGDLMTAAQEREVADRLCTGLPAAREQLDRAVAEAQGQLRRDSIRNDFINGGPRRVLPFAR